MKERASIALVLLWAVFAEFSFTTDGALASKNAVFCKNRTGKTNSKGTPKMNLVDNSGVLIDGNPMKTRHLLIGITFWFAAVAVGWTVLRSELASQSSSLSTLSADVQRWVTGQQSSYEGIADTEIQVALGDPVFAEQPDGSFLQVGLITDLHLAYSKKTAPSKNVGLQIYDSALEDYADGFLLEYHTTPTSLDWVVKMMIPPERQKEIASLIAKEWQVHQKEITSELKPVIQTGIRTAMKAVEAELPAILREHRGEFRALGERYETDILKAEVIPLVREEILPIIEEEAVPVATEVGKALWKRVSLWAFTWRYLYDKTPISKKDSVKEEFQRFIDEEALPELRTRTDQFIDVTEIIVKRSMENPRVKAAMKKNFKQVAEDPELHRLVWNVVRQAVVENETLRQELDFHMKRHETRSAMRIAGNRLEPVVREIGDMIFGSREKGITPEFSRILRAQILTKDRRWFVITPGFEKPQETGKVTIDTTDWPMLYPMGFGGEEQSPLTQLQD